MPAQKRLRPALKKVAFAYCMNLAFTVLPRHVVGLSCGKLTFTVLPRHVVGLSCLKLAFTNRDFGTDFHSKVKIGHARWGYEDRRLVDFCLPKPHFNSVNINKSLIMLNSWPINKALVFLWWRFPTLAGFEILGMRSTGTSRSDAS